MRHYTYATDQAELHNTDDFFYATVLDPVNEDFNIDDTRPSPTEMILRHWLEVDSESDEVVVSGNDALQRLAYLIEVGLDMEVAPSDIVYAIECQFARFILPPDDETPKPERDGIYILNADAGVKSYFFPIDHPTPVDIAAEVIAMIDGHLNRLVQVWNLGSFSETILYDHHVELWLDGDLQHTRECSDFITPLTDDQSTGDEATL